ncbi:anti-phage deoxyguanosine triphosphatase [Vibrio sp. HN007]|uniref:anti-phage deoxyguanosine triphosphatase n=1 Tax=Vibrio iocasae TaxID=3098914 RepID=UPI0035D4F667
MDSRQLELWQHRINNEHKLRRKDHRDPFQRDRARILHSAAFRRLQAKTQIHGTGANDFHRTRLTHSLEAAQIGSGILAQIQQRQVEYSPILPSASLIEALCLAHDIGHPPFGHGGEVALNYAMRDHGGFEGNAQTFRIVTQLEPYTQHNGMNLSRRTLLGLIKYPALLSKAHSDHYPDPVVHQRQLRASEWAPAKGIYDVDTTELNWVLEPLSEADKDRFSALREDTSDNPLAHRKSRFKSLDCSIMELADDIAYGVHDLEDAIVLGLIDTHQWQEGAANQLANCGAQWFEGNIQAISHMLFSGEHYLRKDAIGGIVNTLLTGVSVNKVSESFESELLSYNAYLEPGLDSALAIFKRFVSEYVIKVPEVQRLEYRGQQIVIDLFEALSADPERLLPEATRKKWQRADESDEGGMRVICDYIANMTDGYAQKLHQQLFSAHSLY